MTRLTSQILVAVVGAIVGSIATAALNPATSHIIIYLPDGQKIMTQKVNSFDKDGTASIYLTADALDSIRKSAPKTEAAFPNNFFVDGINNVTYADSEDQIPQVKQWLNNQYSGYPSLKDTLSQLLAGRCPQGNPVPLTIINAHYLGNTGQPTMQHDTEKLKSAYIGAWKEKNSGSSFSSFDEIAPICKK